MSRQLVRVGKNIPFSRSNFLACWAESEGRIILLGFDQDFKPLVHPKVMRLLLLMWKLRTSWEDSMLIVRDSILYVIIWSSVFYYVGNSNDLNSQGNNKCHKIIQNNALYNFIANLLLVLKSTLRSLIILLNTAEEIEHFLCDICFFLRSIS